MWGFLDCDTDADSSDPSLCPLNPEVPYFRHVVMRRHFFLPAVLTYNSISEPTLTEATSLAAFCAGCAAMEAL